MTKMTCSSCGAELPEEREEKIDSTIQCPKCGQTLMTLEISEDVFEKVKAYGKEIGLTPDQVIERAIKELKPKEAT